MREFETGAVRDVGGKGRMDLLPWCSLLRISKHMEDSLTHYPERNWEAGLPMHSMLDSAMRHMAKYMDGWKDEDHLAAAATNLLMALWTEEKLPEMQDIPSRGGKPAAKPEEKKTGVCKYYDEGRCMGTKELDPCRYDGVVALCSGGRYA